MFRINNKLLKGISWVFGNFFLFVLFLNIYFDDSVSIKISFDRKKTNSSWWLYDTKELLVGVASYFRSKNKSQVTFPLQIRPEPRTQRTQRIEFFRSKKKTKGSFVVDFLFLFVFFVLFRRSCPILAPFEKGGLFWIPLAASPHHFSFQLKYLFGLSSSSSSFLRLSPWFLS